MRVDQHLSHIFVFESFNSRFQSLMNAIGERIKNCNTLAAQNDQKLTEKKKYLLAGEYGV